jgi:hypothetical protein
MMKLSARRQKKIRSATSHVLRALHILSLVLVVVRVRGPGCLVCETQTQVKSMTSHHHKSG